MTRLKFNEIYFVPDIQSKRQICVNISKKTVLKSSDLKAHFSANLLSFFAEELTGSLKRPS